MSRHISVFTRARSARRDACRRVVAEQWNAQWDDLHVSATKSKSDSSCTTDRTFRCLRDRRADTCFSRCF